MTKMRGLCNMCRRKRCLGRSGKRPWPMEMEHDTAHNAVVACNRFALLLPEDVEGSGSDG